MLEPELRFTNVMTAGGKWDEAAEAGPEVTWHEVVDEWVDSRTANAQTAGKETYELVSEVNSWMTSVCLQQLNLHWQPADGEGE